MNKELAVSAKCADVDTSVVCSTVMPHDAVATIANVLRGASAELQERMKQKKEAEKARRDAEEAEKRKLEEARRLEQERKAREAAAIEKKR